MCQPDLGAALPQVSPGLSAMEIQGVPRAGERDRLAQPEATRHPGSPHGLPSAKRTQLSKQDVPLFHGSPGEDNPATAVVCQKRENWAWALPNQSPQDKWEGVSRHLTMRSHWYQDLCVVFSSQVRQSSDYLSAASSLLNTHTYRNTITAFFLLYTYEWSLSE